MHNFQGEYLSIKNKNQSRRSLEWANLNEVLNKNNMVMAGVSIFEMRWNFIKLLRLRNRSHSIKDAFELSNNEFIKTYLSYLFSTSTNIRKGVTLVLHLEHLGLFIIHSYIKCEFLVVTTTPVPFPPSLVGVGCESNTLIFWS